MPAEQAGRLAELLAGGYFTHDFPITVHRARDLGLAVGTDLPMLVYELMALFPQPTRGRPSVTYLPLQLDGEYLGQLEAAAVRYHTQRLRVVAHGGRLHLPQVLAVQLQPDRDVAGDVERSDVMQVGDVGISAPRVTRPHQAVGR